MGNVQPVRRSAEYVRGRDISPSLNDVPSINAHGQYRNSRYRMTTRPFIGSITNSVTDDSQWTETVYVENVMVDFKLDTGAQTSVIPEHIFMSLPKSVVLKPTVTKLKSYSGYVKVNGKNNLVRFMVVKDGSAILGRDACIHLGLV